MRINRFVPILFIVCWVLVRHACATDVKPPVVCHLPKTAVAVLADTLPDWTIVSTSDLTEHDRMLWNAIHYHHCPGIAVGDYFGNRNLSLAVTLINRQPTKMLQTLVVLKPRDGSYELIELSKPQEASRALVVFRLGPAVFDDIETGEKSKITCDSVAYEDIAAGMLIYAWHSGKFMQIQASE